MLTITMFAIRVRNADLYLPEAPGGLKSRRGATLVEPVRPNRHKLPRLFKTQNHAQVALTAWLKGRVVVTSHYDRENYPVEDVVYVPVKGRDRSMMEVVPVTVQLPGSEAATFFSTLTETEDARETV